MSQNTYWVKICHALIVILQSVWLTIYLHVSFVEVNRYNISISKSTFCNITYSYRDFYIVLCTSGPVECMLNLLNLHNYKIVHSKDSSKNCMIFDLIMYQVIKSKIAFSLKYHQALWSPTVAASNVSLLSKCKSPVDSCWAFSTQSTDFLLRMAHKLLVH